MLVYLDGKYSSGCGYCKHKIPNEKRKIKDDESLAKKENWGVEGYQVGAEVYDLLIQHNWRRCGSFYYKPLNEHMCCPQYAIRVACPSFSIKKPEHRRDLRRLRRYLLSGSHLADPEKTEQMVIDGPADVKTLTHILQEALGRLFQENVVPKVEVGPKVKFNQATSKNKAFYSCAVVLNIFGLFKKQKVECRVLPAEVSSWIAKCVAEIGLDGFRVEACSNGYLNFYPTDLPTAPEPIEELTREQKPAQKYRLFLKVAPSSLIQEEFDLYFVYQQEIHKDKAEKITTEGYDNFLCNSSLVQTSQESFEIEVTPKLDGTDYEFEFRFKNNSWFSNGSYHIRYELENESGERTLMAVSVVDALPTGLSSVYFMYYPKFGFLSPGVVSALLELLLIKQKVTSVFQYYYLGFYIHDCSKMRYKGQFDPSDILCPITNQWVQLDDRLRNYLDEYKYGKFALTDSIVETERLQAENMNYWINRQVVPGEWLLGKVNIKPSMLEAMQEFSKLTDSRIWANLIFILLPEDVLKK